MSEPLDIVLDTSVFTNPDTAGQWGQGTPAAFATFLELAGRLRDHVRFLMPPSVFDELQHFLGDMKLPAKFEFLVVLQSPDRFMIKVPGFLLYELIDDVRDRINRGLRVAEKAVRQVDSENVDKTINRLRNQYREALRAGILDSREDVDLILLSKELNAALVASDHGVRKWADKLGIRLIHPERLRELLEGLLPDPAPDATAIGPTP